MRVALLCLAALATSSCTLAFSTRVPSKWTVETEPKCTTNSVPIFLDVAISAALAAVVVDSQVNHVANEEGTHGPNSLGGKDTELFLLTPFIAPFALSAITGAFWGSTCRDARQERKKWLQAQQQEPAPQDLTPENI